MHNVVLLKIEKDAIPCIEALHLMSMPKLGFIPEGIEFLSSLKKLVMDMDTLHPYFEDRWNEFRWLIHIREIQKI